jgi:hypothetical protein
MSRVGINNAAPSTALDVTGSVTADGLTVGDTSDSQTIIQMLANSTNGANTIHFGDAASGAASYVGYINYAHDSNSMQFSANGAERMRIDASGNIKQNSVNTSTNVGYAVNNGTYDAIALGTGGFSVNGGAATDGGIRAYNNLLFGTGASSTERMRIDSSGNLMVGVTSAGADGGVTLSTTGYIQARIDNDTAAYFDRTGAGDDGEVIRIQQNGTTVGSIGTNSGYLFIGGTAGNDAFLSFGADGVRPSTSAGAARDAAIDLGGSSNRFKDLYLSESVKLSANDAGGAGSNSIDFAHTGHTSGPSAQIHVDYTSDFRANLLFKINKAQSNSAPTEVARFTNGGNLLVGTTDSSVSVDVGIKLRAGSADKGVALVSANSTSASEGFTMWSTGANAWRFYVGWNGQINATSNTIQAISDQRFKENIRDLDDGLSKVMQLKPRKFDWKEGKGADTKNARGFIAQEFEEVFPDLIGEWKDPAPEGEEPYKAVSQDLIPTLVKAIQEQQVPTLVKAIQEQQATIEALTARIAALES